MLLWFNSSGCQHPLSKRRRRRQSVHYCQTHREHDTSLWIPLYLEPRNCVQLAKAGETTLNNCSSGSSLQVTKPTITTTFKTKALKSLQDFTVTVTIYLNGNGFILKGPNVTYINCKFDFKIKNAFVTFFFGSCLIATHTIV